jgi:hypothetical protein
MARLARQISIVIVEEYGSHELLNRLADPYWFQAFGCVLGFDWHSSGVTTTVCGAMKEGLRGVEQELGFYVAGGKGGTSRKTPQEIQAWGNKVSLGKDPKELVYASKMSAKVDSTAVQDGYQLYHHNFFFTNDGSWTVVQQGMNLNNRFARRYHWRSDEVTSFVESPETRVCDDKKYTKILNLVSDNSQNSRKVISEIALENPIRVLDELHKIIELAFPRREWIEYSDIRQDNIEQVLLKTYENQPKNFEQLLGIKGLGPKSMRALNLVAEIAYGTKADWSDPVKYSFAHGGKDGYPYPVDRETYDKSIEFLKKAVQKAKVERSEKKNMLMKLWKNF